MINHVNNYVNERILSSSSLVDADIVKMLDGTE